jgi:hypothetical protein
MKIRLVGAELFHADGQTDMTKLIVAIFNSANARKNRNFKPRFESGTSRIRIDNNHCTDYSWMLHALYWLQTGSIS